jgi:hypothetical protein
MTASGHLLPKSDVCVTSALLLIATEQRTSHEVSSGPCVDMAAPVRDICFAP